MERRSVPGVLVSIGALTLPVPASATVYSVRFCAELDVDYSDYVGGQQVSDDFLTGGTADARGVLFQVIDNTNANHVYDQYTPDDGTWSGCTSVLSLNSTHNYLVRFYSEAQLGNNTIVLTNTGFSEFVHTEHSAYVPSGDTTDDFTTSTNAAWNILAATSEALYRHDGGVSDTFYVVQANTGGNYLDPSTGISYVETDDWKSVSVHELGHQLEYRSSGATFPAYNYTAEESGTPNACNTLAVNQGDSGTHYLNTKEYQSAAAVEGLATFYAVLTFNDSTQNDCEFGHQRNLDWDADGDKTDDADGVPGHDSGLGAGAIGCEGGPNLSTTPIDAHDYLGDWCLASGQTDNRATQYDYVRFLWDEVQDQGLTLQQILSIYDLANAEVGGWTASGSGSGEGWPAHELSESADDLGLLTEWDNEDNANGVQR